MRIGSRNVNRDAAANIVCLQQRGGNERRLLGVVLDDDAPLGQEGVSRLVFTADWKRCGAHVPGLPAQSGAQKELVFRRLELQHLAVAHLQYLRHQAHGIFEQSVEFSTLQRELAQLRQCGLLLRCAVRRILLLWEFASGVRIGHEKSNSPAQLLGKFFKI